MTFFTEKQWLAWIDKLPEEDYAVIESFLPVNTYRQVRQFFLEHEVLLIHTSRYSLTG